MTSPTAKNSGQRTGWRSLTVQLISLIVLPLTLIVLAITVGSTTLHQNAMRDLVGARDERFIQMAAQAIDDQVSLRENAIRGLALQGTELLEPGDEPVTDFQALLDRSSYLDELFSAGMVVVDPRGNIVAARSPGANLLPNDRRVIAEGIQALRQGLQSPVAISPIFTLSEGEKRAYFVFAPTANQQYLLAGGFYGEALAEQAMRGAFSQGQVASVLAMGSGGEVLYQKGFSSLPADLLTQPVAQQALAGETGRTYATTQNGELVVAYTSVDRLNLRLLIVEPWEQVASPLLETTHLAPLAMIPVLLLALFALLFAFRQIVHPLRALSKQAGSLGWGDYEAIEQPVGGIEEIRYLQLELVRMTHKVRAAQRSLHSYIGAITSGQEDERRRLARELHDETIQSLISFKQHIQLVEMDYADQPVAEALNKLESAAEQTIENVRRMVRALRPIYLEDLGLVPALNMLVTETGQAAGISINVDRRGKERRLDPAVELALYRIVQEALRNIARHSEATRASVTLSFDTGGVKVTVADNGKGFRVPNSPAEFAPIGHFGLLGMFERAELIGGNLQVSSVPGEGTRLTVSVPAPA